MVATDRDKTRFNYRVAGVAIHEGRVLLDRNSRNNYWVLPGGHPELMESMRDALRREMQEEIGADVEVVRLLWMMENFYRRKREIHELSFYFLVTIKAGSPLLQSEGPFYGQEHENQLTFRWFPLEEPALRALPLYPGNLASALMHIPEHPQHLVFHDQVQTQSKRLTIS